MNGEELDSSPEPTPELSWVKTWPQAIELLDRNPWAKLVPLSVHADFRDEVLFEVTRRLLADPSNRNEKQMERWLLACESKPGISKGSSRN